MSTFIDNQGRKHSLDINIESTELVHKATGVSIYLLLDDKMRPLGELVSNLPVLAHVCYILANAEGQGISQRDFALALKGDVIQAMLEAFLEELTAFFPDSRRRAAIAEFVRAIKMVETKAMAMLEKETQALDLERLTDQCLTKITSMRSGASPDSSASPIPDP